MPRGAPPGVRYGGRQKGTPNKKTALVADKLAEMGFDPIACMVDIAMDVSADLGLRGKMAAELAQFVFPKRKAVEHDGNVDSNLTIEVRRFTLGKDGVKDA